MSRALGSFTFPQGAIWPEQHHAWGIAQQNIPVLSGHTRVVQTLLHSGQAIAVQFPEDSCWLTYAENQHLRSLVEVIGAVYPFTWDGFSSDVMVDWTNGGLQLEPLMRYEDAPAQDKYIGSLFLITV